MLVILPNGVCWRQIWNNTKYLKWSKSHAASIICVALISETKKVISTNLRRVRHEHGMVVNGVKDSLLFFGLRVYHTQHTFDPSPIQFLSTLFIFKLVRLVHSKNILSKSMDAN